MKKIISMLLVVVVLSSVIQLLIKAALKKIPFDVTTLNFKDLLKLAKEPLIILAVLLFTVNLLLWLSVVSLADLSLVYPALALSYAIVAFLSGIFFNENITLLRWFAIALISIGVLLLLRT